jgi:DNA polymerase-3 subunit delta
MRLKADQLYGALQKSLAPVYLISGDEPLQLAEAADSIRHSVRQNGYTSREVIAIENGGEWHQLTAEAGALSIFSDKKLIDLRLPSSKLGEGGKVLLEYGKNPPEDTILLITMAKLEAAALKSQWFQTLDNIGVMVQIWPLQGTDLQNWLKRRAENKGMKMEVDALKSLLSRIEGNLLAAAQEVEKLYILYGQTVITKAMVDDDVADNSRFDVFKLVDALLLGKINRAIKILNGLKVDGIAEPVVLWAISREARNLFHIRSEHKFGKHSGAVLKNSYVPDKQKQAQQQALSRLKDHDLQSIILLCNETDRQIKGQATGDSWESLFTLCMKFCQNFQH